MKKIFLDSDVILDILLFRPGFYEPAANLIALANQYDFVTSAVAFVNVHYFLERYDRSNKFDSLAKIHAVISIVEVGEHIIDMALKSRNRDFEDTIQYYAAMSAKADVIITRNIKDYKQFTIPAMTAADFLKTL